MSRMSAYLATVLRLTPSCLDILALGIPRASISRISCCVSRGTAIFPSSSRRRFAKVNSPRENVRRGRVPCAWNTAACAIGAQFPMRTVLTSPCGIYASLIAPQHTERPPAGRDLAGRPLRPGAPGQPVRRVGQPPRLAVRRRAAREPARPRPRLARGHGGQARQTLRRARPGGMRHDWEPRAVAREGLSVTCAIMRDRVPCEEPPPGTDVESRRRQDPERSA